MRKILVGTLITFILMACNFVVAEETENENLPVISEIFTKDDKLMGAKDADGNIILPAIYKSFERYIYANAYYLAFIKEGVDSQYMAGGYVIIDQNGQYVVGPVEGSMANIDFISETYTYTRDDDKYNWHKTFVMTFDGKNITPAGYRESESLGNGFIMGLNPPILTTPVIIDAFTGPDYDYEAIKKTLITPGGLEIEMKHSDKAFSIGNRDLPHIYRDFALLSNSGVESIGLSKYTLIHRNKGIIDSYYDVGVVQCSDDIEENYVYGVFRRDGSFESTHEFADFFYIDVFNGKGEKIFSQLDFSEMEKTVNGFVLEGRINSYDVKKYFWADARPVTDEELDEYLYGKVYTGFDNDNNDRSAWDYYPTVQGSKIDFALDQDFMELINYTPYYAGASAKHNMIWYNEKKNPDTSVAVIVFNDNNSVDIKLKAFNKDIKIFLEDTLNYTFDRKIIYNTLEKILTDIESVQIKKPGQGSLNYTTNDLPDKAFMVDLIEVDYDSTSDVFDITLRYDSDLQTQGLKAFEDKLDIRLYPIVDVKNGSVNAVKRFISSTHVKDGLDKSGEDIFLDYIKEKFAFRVNDRGDGVYHFYNGIGYISDGKKVAEFNYGMDGECFVLQHYNEASKSFVKHILDGLYSKEVAEQGYSRLFADYDDVINKYPGYSDVANFGRLGNKFVENGSMVMEYKNGSVYTGWTYPIFVSENYIGTHYTKEDLTAYNLGLTEEVTIEYLYNYFRPYGYIVDAYDGFNGHLVLSGYNLTYNKGSRYGSSNDLEITKREGNVIDVHLPTYRYFFTGMQDAYELTEDYFKLVFGDERSKLLMQKIDEDFKMHDDGYKGNIVDGVEYQVGDLTLRYWVNSRLNILITYPDPIKEDSVEKEQFTDVKPTDWFSKDILELVDKGSVSGYPDGTFGPHKSITLGEFLKTAISTAENGSSYADTKGIHWANGMLDYALDKKIILDGEFKPSQLDDKINRYDMARIMVRITEILKGESPSDTSKVSKIMADYSSVPEKYRYYVDQAYAKGLLGGVDDKGTYGGEFLGNRAEASVMIIRMINKSRRKTVVFE